MNDAIAILSFISYLVSLILNISAMKLLCSVAALLLFFIAQSQQKTTIKNTASNPPALSAIKEAELKRDLYAKYNSFVQALPNVGSFN